MKSVYIVSGARTPFGKFGGTLKDFSTVRLSALIMDEIVGRSKLDKQMVEEVNWGVCSQAEAEEVVAPVIARQALLKAGLSVTTVSATIDRACCSGMAAVKLSFQSIQAGEYQVSLAGGAEIMSRIPMVIRPLRWGNRLGDVVIRDPAHGLRYMDYNLVAIDAAEVALEYGVTREDQDHFSYESQKRWEDAHINHRLDEEMMPVMIRDKDAEEAAFMTDEQPRPNTTVEKLSRLPVLLGSATVTAGNAPGLNDGAAGLLLMSEAKVREHELRPLATIVSAASIAASPKYIATAPALAIRKALQQADLTLEQMTLIEINEAFAAVPLVSAQLLADHDRNKIRAIREKLNVNGGAIAIGHPVGASGARILLTLIHELKRRGGGYGVAAICGGLAQGEAIIVKVEA